MSTVVKKGQPNQKVVIDEDIGDIEASTSGEFISQRKNKFKSKRGAKLLGPKPKGAKRVLFAAKPITNRPTNVYKEWVVDQDGVAGWCIWYTTEQSDYVGIEEIVKLNPKTEEELSQGFDYTIDFSIEKAKELIKESFGATTFYLKDGVNTFVVKKEDLEVLFLNDVKAGLTPKTN